jgi:hypothetical protein
MGLVVDYGFTEDTCFGADIFPIRVQNWYLRRASKNRDPFQVYHEFRDLFISRHLPNFLRFGGKVLLVLGNNAFARVNEVLRLKKVDLDESIDHLSIY